MSGENERRLPRRSPRLSVSAVKRLVSSERRNSRRQKQVDDPDIPASNTRQRTRARTPQKERRHLSGEFSREYDVDTKPKPTSSAPLGDDTKVSSSSSDDEVPRISVRMRPSADHDRPIKNENTPSKSGRRRNRLSLSPLRRIASSPRRLARPKALQDKLADDKVLIRPSSRPSLSPLRRRYFSDNRNKVAGDNTGVTATSGSTVTTVTTDERRDSTSSICEATTNPEEGTQNQPKRTWWIALNAHFTLFLWAIGIKQPPQGRFARIMRRFKKRVVINFIRKRLFVLKNNLIVQFILLFLSVCYLVRYCLPMVLPHELHSPQPFDTVFFTNLDKYSTARRSYTFFFTTGRSGTQHISKVLTGDSNTIITHEQEHLSIKTRKIVYVHYRPIAAQISEEQFNTSANMYVSQKKVPFYKKLLDISSAKRLIYTGHLPAAFGLIPFIIQNLPKGTVRVVRVRRDRVATALSLMALGEESEDPWGATKKGVEDAPIEKRRWFPTPTDGMVRLHVKQEVWNHLNRFQRWLWYVDDLECRWQALKYGMGNQFSWMEMDLEEFGVMDGGLAYKRLANFTQTRVNWLRVGLRDNSIQLKKRRKEVIDEELLRHWDTEYRKQMGQCEMGDGNHISWVS